jgi:hypothetical protein
VFVSTLAMYDGSAPTFGRFVSLPAAVARRAKAFLATLDAALSPPATETGDAVERDIAGETVCGFRVAAYRETHPEHGAKYGHQYSEHWSTPNSKHPKVTVERLFTEDQLRAAIASTPADETVTAVFETPDGPVMDLPKS